MASVFIGANFGADLSPDKLSEGSSTNSTDLEVQINTTNMAADKGPPTRLDVIQFLEAVVRYLEDGRVTVLTL